MLNRRLYRIVAGGVTGIILFSMAGAWLLIGQISLFFAFVCICIVIVLAIMLMKIMVKTDHRLESFFSSISNNDFNVHFVENNDDKYLNGLFREMNRIMEQFEENRQKQEERRSYYESIIRILRHEISNSVTPIASLSSDLVKYAHEYGKEEIIDGLHTINQQAQQLKTFLNAYHQLTHLPDPVMSRVKIFFLFNKLERLLSSEQGSKNIRYISPEDVEITLDHNLITLALINLIRNALQATATHPHPQIRVEAGREADALFIQVTDNGEGIPPNRFKDVFRSFYSTKREGSGIGLPLSQRIMQLHGGELTVNSQPGESTTLRMIFPAH